MMTAARRPIKAPGGRVAPCDDGSRWGPDGHRGRDRAEDRLLLRVDGAADLPGIGATLAHEIGTTLVHATVEHYGVVTKNARSDVTGAPRSGVHDVPENDPMLAAALDVFDRCVRSADPSAQPQRSAEDSDEIPWWLRAVAYHEAGHAVAVYRFGFTLIEVSTVPDWAGGSLGRVQHRAPSAPVARRYNLRLPFREPWLKRAPVAAEEQALAALAGGWAQRLISDACGFLGCERDRSEAKTLISEHCVSEEEVRASMRRLDRWAAEFVAAERVAIGDLAARLIDRRILSAREALYVIRFSGPGSTWTRRARGWRT